VVLRDGIGQGVGLQLGGEIGEEGLLMEALPIRAEPYVGVAADEWVGHPVMIRFNVTHLVTAGNRTALLFLFLVDALLWM